MSSPKFKFPAAMIAVILLVVVGMKTALAVTPQLINYQGRLLTNAGEPVADGSYSVTFTIYDAAADGNSKWTETQNVTTLNGLFAVLLGSVNPVEDTVFNDASRYLGIKVETDPELSPRTQLSSVPYTYRTGSVNGAYGGYVIGSVSISGDLNVSGKATIGSSHSNNGNGGFCAGTENSTSGAQPTVGGGNFNAALGNQAVVSGGFLNGAGDDYATVGGGYSNVAYLAGTVGGGRYNRAHGAYSVVAGGGGLAALDSNSVLGDYSSIGGGRGNVITGSESTISGGNNNRADGNEATVGGGEDNEANAANATVGGGTKNVASGIESTISGGSHNEATAYLSTVGGGYGNRCYGTYCVIPGGDQDTIAVGAERSMAFGRGVLVSGDYRVVFFDGSYHGRLGVNRDYRDGGIQHPIHVGTDGSNGNGAHLTAGGVWTNGSSRTFKENFQLLDGQDVLEKINRLTMKSWDYKNTRERHIWPCAEDFHEQFDVGGIKADGQRDNQYLAAGDVAGVALAGVQELYRMLQKQGLLTKELKASQDQLAQQSDEINNLRQQVAQLEALVEVILARENQNDDDLVRASGENSGRGR